MRPPFTKREISFSPRQLFGRGRQGVWIEPTPTQCFTDSSGMRPSAPGSAVILSLDNTVDTATGNELAPSLSSWTTVNGSGSVSYLNSSFIFANTGANSGEAVVYTADAVANRVYFYSFTISNFSSGGVVLTIGSRFTPTATANGTYSGYLLGGSGGFFDILSKVAGTSLTVSNISIKQVFGNHAIQTTAANRPTLQQSGNLYFLRHDSTDYLTATLPSINVRRNLLTYSEQFDNAAWTPQRVTITANSVIAPNGTLTGDTITGNGASGGAMSPYQNATASSNTEYTTSVYAKAGTAPWMVIYLYDGATTPGAFFDLVNGAIGTLSSGVTGAIHSVGNGWYRCSATRTTGGSATLLRAQFVHATSATVIATSATLTNYLWGAQIELGSVATPYQKVTDWTSEAYSSSGSTYFGTPQGMSSLHNQSIGSTYNLPAPNTDVYGCVITPSRLSPPEEEQLARYFRAKAGIVGSEDYLWEPGYLTDDSGEQLLLRA